MRMLRGAFFLGFCLFFLFTARATAQENNATLKETVDWLQSKSYLITSVGASSLREALNGKYYAKWETALMNPCTIVLTSTSLQSQPDNKIKEKPEKPGRIIGSNDIHPWGLDVRAPKDPSTITIPLSSLNPQKVGTTVLKGMLGSSGNVTIATTDNKEVIVWRGADKTFNAKSLTIEFHENGMPERVSKALVHAINLCGGHVDKKEPF